MLCAFYRFRQWIYALSSSGLSTVTKDSVFCIRPIVIYADRYALHITTVFKVYVTIIVLLKNGLLPSRRCSSAGTIAMFLCLSVCLSVSVTSRCSVNTDWRIDLIFVTEASFDQ